MARKKNPTSAAEPSNPSKPQKYYLPQEAKWGGFVNLRLTDEDKSDYDAWCADHVSEWWSMQNDLLGAGLKISFSYDAENECYICTYLGRLVSISNERYCLTTRAGTFGDVVALSVWKFCVHLDGNVDNVVASSGYKKWG